MNVLAGSGVQNAVKRHSSSDAYRALFDVWPRAVPAHVTRVTLLGTLREEEKEKKPPLN